MRAVDEASRSPVRTSNPQYVYGIVDAEDAGPSPGSGLFGRPVRFLTSGRLAAVTSDVEGPVPGRREDVLLLAVIEDEHDAVGIEVIRVGDEPHVLDPVRVGGGGHLPDRAVDALQARFLGI